MLSKKTCELNSLLWQLPSRKNLWAASLGCQLETTNHTVCWHLLRPPRVLGSQQTIEETLWVWPPVCPGSGFQIWLSELDRCF